MSNEEQQEPAETWALRGDRHSHQRVLMRRTKWQEMFTDFATFTDSDNADYVANQLREVVPLRREVKVLAAQNEALQAKVAGYEAELAAVIEG